jgi:hypothetical protein
MWILVGDSSHIPILPRTSPTTIRNHEEQHIQPIRDEGKMKTDSDWSESEGKICESVKGKLEDG